MSYGGRVRIARLYQNYEDMLGQTIRVGGWAKSTRAQANILFVEINDGSCFNGLQVVVDKSAPGFAEAAKGITGASFVFKGTLIKSPAKGQEFELQVNDSEGHSAAMIGQCDGTYPIQGRPKPEVSLISFHLI
jgi:asparaginyl-tRNA synthetase